MAGKIEERRPWKKALKRGAPSAFDGANSNIRYSEAECQGGPEGFLGRPSQGSVAHSFRWAITSSAIEKGTVS